VSSSFLLFLFLKGHHHEKSIKTGFRLKQSVLLSFSVKKFFLILKGHHHEKSIKPVSTQCDDPDELISIYACYLNDHIKIPP
jgi:hypothetical protein